jgi:hypothetical protein
MTSSEVDLERRLAEATRNMATNLSLAEPDQVEIREHQILHSIAQYLHHFLRRRAFWQLS